MNRFLLHLFYSLLLTLPVGAQTDASPVFPEERRAELREEIAYTPPEREPEREVPDWFSDFDLSTQRTFWTVTLSIIVLGGLGFFIYRMIGGVELGRRGRGGKADQQVAVTAEEIVEEEMIATGVALSLLERAEAAGQYDVALRLFYIKVLKELNDAGLIRYRKDFSNRDYRRQLGNGPFRDDFRTVTESYERYWFGKYPLDRLSYRLNHKKFSDLLQRIAALQPEKELYE